MKSIVVAIAAAGACIALAGASAGDLVFTPVNPSFGGNPLNSTHLFAAANAQRDATAKDAEIDSLLSGGAGSGSDSGNSDADLFVRQLQGRLLSALAGQVTEAIFGDNPQENGVVTFGDTEVSFVRTIDSIRLTITDFSDGSVTSIVVPQLVSNN
ncbi:curli assembly protein CsgF [Hoeflea sp.]|uniref:curli assembly protein CsgF n=1 Tax=Hoeflea sp. TaxID=1940281 RepID=UPI002AFE326E|nr:curli assembly protein CsgF [Hoeflea sp.]